MDPTLAALQGLNLGSQSNQQNVEQGNPLLSLLQTAQQQQQHQVNGNLPPNAGLWGPGPSGPQMQLPLHRPPPGFAPPPQPMPLGQQRQQMPQYDPLAGLPGFSSDSRGLGGASGLGIMPQNGGQVPPPQPQQQYAHNGPALAHQQPPPGFAGFGPPRPMPPPPGFSGQPQQDQLFGGRLPPPPLPPQQQPASLLSSLFSDPQPGGLQQQQQPPGGQGLNFGQLQQLQQQQQQLLQQQRQQQQPALGHPMQQQQPMQSLLLALQQAQSAQQQQQQQLRNPPPGIPIQTNPVNGGVSLNMNNHQQQQYPAQSPGRMGGAGGDPHHHSPRSPHPQFGSTPPSRSHHAGGRGGHRPSPAPGRENVNRWVEVMDRNYTGKQPECDMDLLNAKLTSLAESLMPTDEERSTWQRAFQTVQQVLLARWPEGRVMLFGSAANGLSVRSSNDIDVSLQLLSVGDDLTAKSEVIEEAGKLFERAGMTEMLTLPKARVPVVKFTVPSTGTKVDVTVNNTLACINTKLLADYCKIDPRLAQLVAVVKHWAKRRAVNDPYRGTLSSYCYVLMCIYHLQSRKPPVLPVLQALPATLSVQVREWKAEFFDDVEALKGFGNENKQTLGELVWQFFEYWAWKHDYMHGVISIRTGSVLPKDEKDWTRRIGNERHLLCVEDPFELSHDLGRTVDKQTRDVMKKEFFRAATLMRDSEDPMDQLFEKLKTKAEK